MLPETGRASKENFASSKESTSNVGAGRSPAVWIYGGTQECLSSQNRNTDFNNYCLTKSCLIIKNCFEKCSRGFAARNIGNQFLEGKLWNGLNLVSPPES